MPGVRLRVEPEDRQVAALAALAVAIHVLEGAFPSPLPGAKPGLANIITVIVLMQFGWATACWVALLRVCAGGLLLGTFLAPTFLLSLSGALAAMAVLRPAVALGCFGAVGYSLLASMAHVCAQLLCAWLLFIPHPGIWKLLPILLSFALIFGVFNGIIAGKVHTEMRN